ncbi:Bile acid:sodium symporter [Desulfarculus baarsii DSM 2075]|uniref:Bile acid:sodium symporter n=1 Tax=Desulfarculus baarsii (strain ATCC 33931 / DSM 2075 / LMG 7858 / VKM B-1802 / 2st14) TaxID=644282 RepID=E1QDL2_DESB2|nr:bile acid:sodium symporter [Desulfarculus baarsii]ADK83531.1 Bile acid:sodium symporter [Desulfarculus baarsii DSM 2075]
MSAGPRPADWALLLAAMGGLAAGWLWPRAGIIIAPYLAWCMAGVLFLAFLRLDFAALTRVDRASLGGLATWTTLKLILLPLAAWAVTAILAPRWALAALVLSGVSAGVTSPFFAGLLGADMAGALRLVMASSLLAPLSLPALVELLAGRHMSASLTDMAAMLAAVILSPLLLARVCRLLWPRAALAVAARGLPLNLAIIFCANAGVMAKYGQYLRGRPLELLAALGLACLLALAYAGIGLGLGRLSNGRLDGLTGAAGLAFCNNILALVFAERFFGPLEALLCAAYTAPYFLVLIPLRLAAGRAGRSER